MTVNHGPSRQFIRMEKSGLNAEPNHKGYISRELSHISKNRKYRAHKQKQKQEYLQVISTLLQTLTLVVSNRKLSTQHQVISPLIGLIFFPKGFFP